MSSTDLRRGGARRGSAGLGAAGLGGAWPGTAWPGAAWHGVEQGECAMTLTLFDQPHTRTALVADPGDPQDAPRPPVPARAE